MDYPNSGKKRKMYLCLMVGQSEIPKGLGENGMEIEGGDAADGDDKVKNEKRRRRERLKGKKVMKGAVDKDWILKKKELYRTRGKEGVPRDSKVGSALRCLGVLLTDCSDDLTVHGEEAKAKVLSVVSRGLFESLSAVYEFASSCSCCK